MQSWYKLNPVIGGVLLCILLVITFRHYYLQAITPPADLLLIDSAVFSLSSKQDFDGKNALQQRSLPDDWLSKPSGEGYGWYHTTINLMQIPKGLWGIYLPVVQMNAKIYINSVLVGQIGEMDGLSANSSAFSRAESRPYYFTLPENLLNKNDNHLSIHVEDSSGNGLLGKIYLGAEKIVRSVADKRFSMLITSKRVITAGMFAIAILMSVLWVLRRQDRVYGWFALMLYTWSVHNVLGMGLDIPFSQNAQNVLSLVALGWFVVFMVKATHNYMGQQFPIREKLMLSIGVIGSLGILFYAKLPWSSLITHQLWSTFVLMLAGYALLDFTVKYRDREDLHNPLIIPAGFSMLAFGLHDWMLLMQIISREEGRLLHFSAPVSVAVFGALLLERFAKVLKKAESLNLELEQRVAEKHHELEANYRRLKEMEDQRLLTEERERFTKEIHDGVGGHLVSMLSMVRSGKQDSAVLVSAIEATLGDLRIMIDSLTPQEHDIPSLLGAMRMRIEPQLASSGLKLHWRVSELPVIPGFGPHKALQVMRIVQEAITNVIRHADANNIIIKAYTEGDRQTGKVVVEISDDGCGVSMNKDCRDQRGCGVANMHHRAKEIGARFDIVNTQPGTSVKLFLPIK